MMIIPSTFYPKDTETTRPDNTDFTSNWLLCFIVFTQQRIKHTRKIEMLVNGNATLARQGADGYFELISSGK